MTHLKDLVYNEKFATREDLQKGSRVNAIRNREGRLFRVRWYLSWVIRKCFKVNGGYFALSLNE